MFAAWLHDLSPFLVRFSGGVGVRWYGLSYLMGFLVGWLVLRWLSKRGVTPLSPVQITDAMVAWILGVVLGGRLGYVLFYERPLLWTFTDDAPFWGVLALNNGGMSSHGGMIGVILACLWVTRRLRREGLADLPKLHVIDLTAIACVPGLFFGRVANFINGELLGRVAAKPGAAAPWWAVKFPQEVLTRHESFRTPEQAAQLRQLVERFATPTDSFDSAYERVLRTLHAGGAEARQVAADLAPLLSARHPSQLYQAVTDGLVLGAALLLIWAKPRRPGVVGAWFLIVYGVMRIVTEFFRLPDVGVERTLGLSRGQQLSGLMVVAGLVALVILRRRTDRTYGGWLRRPGNAGGAGGEAGVWPDPGGRAAAS